LRKNSTNLKGHSFRPCRKNCKLSPASAAERWFAIYKDLFRKLFSPARVKPIHHRSVMLPKLRSRRPPRPTTRQLRNNLLTANPYPCLMR
jgi:hypothetical protein